MAGSDSTHLELLIRELGELRSELLQIEEESKRQLAGLAQEHSASARNLLHYLVLRRHDLRDLQDRLAEMGFSSLGRAEACVLATLDAVLGLLHRMTDRTYTANPRPPVDFTQGRDLLEKRTFALLGEKPAHRSVRIMVTMPGEAANDYKLVRDLLAEGMDCMRINCAHDNPAAWDRMISHLRTAEKEVGRTCRVLMDLPGPKLRTGALEPGPQVLKWRPQRDAVGSVVAPARLWLNSAKMPSPSPSPATACLPVPARFLKRLMVGDRIKFHDARDSKRCLQIVEKGKNGVWAEANQTAYLIPGTRLRRSGSRNRAKAECEVGELPATEAPLVLHPGDFLLLTRQGLGSPKGARKPARIACTLPQVLADIRPGERIWFDDGEIGAVVREVSPEHVRVEITEAEQRGSKLGADKGINLPDTALHLSPLSSQDIDDLRFIAAHADLVGFSFVRRATDVTELQSRLQECKASHLGIVLKIETAQAFEHLPDLLLAGMSSPCVGVMIARGDLAVECGWERLAELQEEILWFCEAAHVPVIWATQVLEHLAKEGMPSRAEITDAAMGERAECVMLNKGAHIREAVHMLDDILQRMEAHQSKKRSRLRRLNIARHFSSTSMGLPAPVAP